MGRALIAVGSFLALCFVVFGSVVYFTREEDTIAVDALLSESISREVVRAEQQGEPLDLRTVADFDFDRVLIFKPGESTEDISAELGFEFLGELRYTAESSEIFVFTNRGAFVRFADYRGRGRFEGLERPFDYLTAGEAVFVVEDGVARLAGG
jgi:hypothetical protein